jgi:hypothetical protein
VLATKVRAWLGNSEVARDSALVVGTMMIRRTQHNGVKPGKVMATEGMPGSISNQVEQTLARG